MAQLGLIVSSSYFGITALWWLIQVSKHYHLAKHRHCDFTSSVTFPCCPRLHQHPVEGVCKVVFSLIIAIGLFSFRGVKSDFLSNQELATIFIFYMVSGVTDILAKWSGKTFHQGLDYIAFLLFFSIQSVILASRSQFSEQPIKMLYCLLLYVSLALLLVAIMEMKYTDQVLCPLMRSYLFLVQATFGLQVAFIVVEPATNASSGRDAMLMFAMYFSWHCGINFFLVLSVWLIIHKLMQKHLCCCVPLDSAAGTDTIHLENRVHFDYHILDRLESDVE